MHTILETSLRTLIGFLTLLFLTRILGKKQLGQVTIFTYIAGIAMGNMAGDMAVHRDIKIIDAIAGLGIWTLLTLLIEFISLKSSKARVFLDGEPTIVIKKGKIMRDKLASQRLNIDDLTMMLRMNNVFSMQDVEYAILEPNGKLSILKKHDIAEVTRKDLNIPTAEISHIPIEIIVDGKLIEQNLLETGKTKQWLDQQLNKAGIKSVDEVFYGELQSDGSLYICKNKS